MPGDRDIIRTLTGDEPAGSTWATFVAWLVGEAGPDDRHRVAMAWNWGGGEDVLAWIGRQPDCDRATALLLFWNGQPEYYLKYDGERSRVDDMQVGGFDFVADIRRRWQDGFYRRAELAFSLDDPATWPRDFAELDAAFGARAAADMPHDMRVPLLGRVLSADDHPEGIPARFWGDL